MYEKRDSFPYFIVRLHYIDRNIPKNIFYSSFVDKTLRLGGTTLYSFVEKYKNVIHP